MARYSSPFESPLSLQQALDAFRASTWLDSGLSGGGAYPPINVFRQGDDFALIAEAPPIAPAKSSGRCRSSRSIASR